MYFSMEHDILYVRVPCTGSTSIVRSSLGFKQIGHGDHEKAQAFGGWAKYPSSRRIGFVRNPLDWFGTVFNAHKMWREWSVAERDLEDWQLAERCDTPFDWFMQDDQQVITEIWRTEDLDQFFTSLGAEPAHMNKTGGKYPLSEKAVDIIHQRFDREWSFYR